MGMKKVTHISLIGPALLIILRVIEILKKVSALGFGNNYYCNLSTDAKCSLSYYIFKSDDALISYIAIVGSFLILFIATSYILYLNKLYKNNEKKLFWTLVALTAVVIVVSPFIITLFREF
jgi:hypothetical protein